MFIACVLVIYHRGRRAYFQDLELCLSFFKHLGNTRAGNNVRLLDRQHPIFILNLSQQAQCQWNPTAEIQWQLKTVGYVHGYGYPVPLQPDI